MDELLIAYESLREEKDMTSDAYVVWTWRGEGTNDHVDRESNIIMGYDIFIR